MNWVRWLVWLSVGALLVLFSETLRVLVVGWIPYVGRVLPEVEVNHDLLWSGVGGAVLAGVLVQVVMRWFVDGWRVKQTLGVMGVLGAMFASSICGAGIVHQVVLLNKESVEVRTALFL